MQSIGEKIRIRRIIKGYSQEYMAFMLEISQAAYSNLERDETEMTIRRVYEIAEIFEISPYELMPKPKFGSGINYHRIMEMMNDLRRSFQTGIKPKRFSHPVL
ncbi:helix-turn-helix domain-containing protein [Mucilaginibacter lutimaris]|uniref:Helix-turn-helix domain-containing protein n=1 Tax=Mucilaginibacter lutimaris TaxID=931629 RepID=A0ABW2ZEB0_9SPHI